ncbi:MAG: MliC family protein [Elusimicrobiota bacterium]|jgi:membrane-bound inhibitor of C-type lysozyme
MFTDRRMAAVFSVVGAGLTFLAATMSGPAVAAGPRPGGFTKQEPSAPEFRQVVKAAEELIGKKYPDREVRLTKLKEVSTQVVAGLNYKLVCDYSDRRESGTVEVIVYRDLSGKFSLANERLLKAGSRGNEGTQGKRLKYATTFGGSIVVELLDGDRISVSYGETRHELLRAISGSGARYSADGVTFWMKGDDATFENEKTAELVRCTRR